MGGLEGQFWTRINDPAVVCLDEEQANQIVYRLRREISGAVRMIRGKKCGSKPALMNEVGAALQLGNFGENWDALDECITDLENEMPAAWYLLHIRQIEQVLPDDDHNFAIFIELLWSACRDWAEPTRRAHCQGETLVPIPFNVLISGTVEGRRRAQAVLDRLGATSGEKQTTSEG